MGLADTFATLAQLPAEQRSAFVAAALAEPDAEVQLAALRLAPPASVVDGFAELVPAARAAIAAAAADYVRIARERIVGGRDRGRLGAFHLIAAVGGEAAPELLALGVDDPGESIREVVLRAIEARVRALIAGGEPGGEPLPPEQRDALLQALAAVLRHFAAHREAVFVDLLVDLGTVAMPLVSGTVFALGATDLQAAFAAALGRRASRGAVALLFALATGNAARPRGVALDVLQQRRDVEFGVAVAVHVAATREPRAIAALRGLRGMPWLPAVTSAAVHVDAAAALPLLQWIRDCGLAPAERQGHLEAWLGHPVPEVRARALEALQVLRCPKGLAAVERALADPVDLVRRAAAQVVVALEPHNKLALLTPLLGAADAATRRVAMREVGKVCFSHYLQRYEHMDPKTRRIAAKALAKVDASMLDRLAEEVRSLDAARRLRALHIVEFVDAADALRAPLLELIDDPDARVRATAVCIVELAGSREGTKILVEMLADPDRRVRANAVEAFEQLGDRRHIALLTPCLRDGDNRVRANAAKALWHLGWSEAKDELLDMLADPDEGVRISAAWAIGEVRLPGAREALEAREAVELSTKVRVKIRAAIAALGQEAET